MNNSYFSRETTSALKGIALILMFVHHFFTFPDWIVCGVDYPWIQEFTVQFCAPTDLCVSLFAFLSGYFYAFSAGTLRYSLRKITDFLISYWLLCIPMVAVAALTGCYTLSKIGLVLEMLGLESTVMSFCWYVNFFCIIMLALPLLTWKDSQSPVMDALVLLIIPTIVLNIWWAKEERPLIQGIALNLRQWYPCVAVGYLFGKYGLFEKWFDDFILGKGKSGVIRQKVLFVVLVWAAFRGRYYIEGLNFGSVTFRSGDHPVMLTEDVLFAPMFLYGAANLLALIQNRLGFRVLEAIGKRSMLMWFYHCIFFNCCKQYTQIFLYYPRNPLLVLLNGLLLCYIAAALTEPVRKAVIGCKEHLFAWIAGILLQREALK